MARSAAGNNDVSASSERIDELETIADKVLRYQQRMHLEPGGPPGFKEWGDPGAVEKLYLPPKVLKRLARQLGPQPRSDSQI